MASGWQLRARIPEESEGAVTDSTGGSALSDGQSGYKLCGMNNIPDSFHAFQKLVLAFVLVAAIAQIVGWATLIKGSHNETQAIEEPNTQIEFTEQPSAPASQP